MGVNPLPILDRNFTPTGREPNFENFVSAPKYDILEKPTCTNSDKSAWDSIKHTPTYKICRPIKGNIESYFNEAENVWTESSLKRKYGNALLDNPALELNQLKQVNKWTDLNIEITMQTGEKFMRAELTLEGEKVVGLANNKKTAKAAGGVTYP